MEALDIIGQASFWAAAIRIATPLIFGVIGALICERAGVLNLGIEGIFVAGAMTGWLAVHLGASLWLGVAVAASVGAALGLLHGVFTVLLGLSQHVTGLGITLLATSTAYFGYRVAFPTVTEPPRIEPFLPLNLDWLSFIPILGPALAQQTRTGVARLPLRGRHRIHSSADAAWARAARGRRQSGGGRGAGTFGRGVAHGCTRSRFGAYGARRGFSHHVRLQRLFLRHDQWPRLGMHSTDCFRILAAGQGDCSAHCCSAPSTPIRCGCRLSPAGSCRPRSS